VRRKQYDQETKARTVRMVLERQKTEDGESLRASLDHVGKLTGISPDTIRGWVSRVRIDAGEKPGATTDEREEIKRLRRENAELRRANEILKTASAFFAAAELDRRLK